MNPGQGGQRVPLHINLGQTLAQGAVGQDQGSGVNPILQQLQQQQRERMEREEQLREKKDLEGVCG